LPSTPRQRAAFTLIEMLAVAIFALLAAFVAPNLGLLSSRRLQQQAERLTAELELARQRTVATGIPHRLAIDLDRGSYRIEWLVTEAESLGEQETQPELDLRGSAPIPMAAPPEAAREFRPLPGMFGRETIEESCASAVGPPSGSVAEARSSSSSNATEPRGPTEIVLADGTTMRSRSRCCPSRKR
jgi:type II secretory pathway pseudopilin PulG